MKEPRHPGAVVKEYCLEQTGITLKKFTAVMFDELRMSARDWNLLFEGKSSITQKIAAALGKRTRLPMEFWLTCQSNFDYYHAGYKKGFNDKKTRRVGVTKFGFPMTEKESTLFKQVFWDGSICEFVKTYKDISAATTLAEHEIRRVTRALARKGYIELQNAFSDDGIVRGSGYVRTDLGYKTCKEFEGGKSIS